MSTEENLIKRQKQRMHLRYQVLQLRKRRYPKRSWTSYSVRHGHIRRGNKSLYALKFSARHMGWHVLAPQVPMARRRDLSF